MNSPATSCPRREAFVINYLPQPYTSLRTLGESPIQLQYRGSQACLAERISSPAGGSLALMPNNIQPEEEPVSTAWQRLVQGVLGVFLLMGTGFMGYYYWPPPTDKLHEQVQELSQQVDQLKQEQAMPAMVLNRYRNSICYIFGVYQVGFAQQRPALR